MNNFTQLATQKSFNYKNFLYIQISTIHVNMKPISYFSLNRRLSIAESSSKISWKVGLCAGSIFQHLFTNRTRAGLQLEGNFKWSVILPFTISRAVFTRSKSPKGSSRVIISHVVTPNDQISLLKEYTCFSNDSGLIHLEISQLHLRKDIFT